MVGNYRQLGAPLLFPRTVSVYLLAGFIDIFPFWTLFLLVVFYFILQREKKTFAASGGDVSFPGCYGDEKADYKAPIGRGKQPLDSREPLAQPEVTVEQKGQVWGQWGRWRWGGMEVSQAGGPGGPILRRLTGTQGGGVASLPAISMSSVNILLPSFLKFGLQTLLLERLKQPWGFGEPFGVSPPEAFHLPTGAFSLGACLAQD